MNNLSIFEPQIEKHHAYKKKHVCWTQLISSGCCVIQLYLFLLKYVKIVFAIKLLIEWQGIQFEYHLPHSYDKKGFKDRTVWNPKFYKIGVQVESIESRQQSNNDDDENPLIIVFYGFLESLEKIKIFVCSTLQWCGAVYAKMLNSSS